VYRPRRGRIRLRAVREVDMTSGLACLHCGCPAPDPDSEEFGQDWEWQPGTDEVICIHCMVEQIRGPLGDLYLLLPYEAEVADIDL
jgi:hypothetical protein